MAYDLDGEVPEHFEFKLGGFVYQMRYPTAEEVQGADKLTDEKQMDWVYGFISSKDEGAPQIRDALNKVNLKVLQKFNEMIMTEFGLGEQ